VSHHLIRVGQFSESPVLAVARALELNTRFGVEWETQRVQSSPAQFESLRSDEIDVAITSPDNVLLYTTTANNPLKEQLDVQFLRPIDRGLRLALYTSSDIDSVEDFTGSTLGVDVMSSGFAILLLQMLASLGVDHSTINFEAVGATPKRLDAIKDGTIQGSVLNAEAGVAAEQAGFRRWATSTDVSDDYLGTVLVQMAGPVSEHTRAFLDMWEAATEAILSLSSAELISALESVAPALANAEYVAILQSAEYGCLSGEVVRAEQLRVLADIRRQSGAYTPNEADILRLTDRA
jgi:ABC-type nitrate/sulfonate/bicarbonate transport system substrate-binding protein